jgi:hypothetical protein
MKKATMKLEVTLTFSGGLTKKQRNSVLFNLHNQLVRDVETAGIVPDDCDEYTETIKVTDTENGSSLEKNFNIF